MFERFTERARQVVVLAQEEAREARSGFIGPEHLLAGLVREEEGFAARVLAHFDANLEVIRGAYPDPDENASTEGQIPFVPAAKRVLELALREALSLGHNYIGTEHILLGLVRDMVTAGDAVGEADGGVAGVRQVLVALTHPEPPADAIRNEVVRQLSGRPARERTTDREGGPVNEASDKHGHEPEIPRLIDAEGSCLVCRILVGEKALASAVQGLGALAERVDGLADTVEGIRKGNPAVVLPDFAWAALMSPERIERGKAERLVRDAVGATLEAAGITLADHKVETAVRWTLGRNPDVEQRA